METDSSLSCPYQKKIILFNFSETKLLKSFQAVTNTTLLACASGLGQRIRVLFEQLVLLLTLAPFSIKQEFFTDPQ
jgi:hypothetical protein